MTIQLSLLAPATKQEIQTEIKKFEAEIKVRQSEIDVLKMGITHYRNQCDHAGQKTGYDERNGSWGNPCPTCGYSY